MVEVRKWWRVADRGMLADFKYAALDQQGTIDDDSEPAEDDDDQRGVGEISIDTYTMEDLDDEGEVAFDGAEIDEQDNIEHVM